MVVVRTHKESMEIEERVFASEEDNVEMRGVFYQFWDGDDEAVPKIACF